MAKNANGNSNGKGTSKVFDPATEAAKKTAAQARKRNARSKGLHQETMTGGIAADRRAVELTRRQEAVETSLIALERDLQNLQKNLEATVESRKGLVRSQLAATIEAIALIEKFRDADFHMSERWNIALGAVYGKIPLAGKVARDSLRSGYTAAYESAAA